MCACMRVRVCVRMCGVCVCVRMSSMLAFLRAGWRARGLTRGGGRLRCDGTPACVSHAEGACWRARACGQSSRQQPCVVTVMGCIRVWVRCVGTGGLVVRLVLATRVSSHAHAVFPRAQWVVWAS